MSNFACEQCGTMLYDTPRGYLTGCEHYPRDCYCHKRTVGECVLCVARGRLAAGEPIKEVCDDYDWD